MGRTGDEAKSQVQATPTSIWWNINYATNKQRPVQLKKKEKYKKFRGRGGKGIHRKKLPEWVEKCKVK